MNPQAAQTHYLKDYQVPDFLIDKVDLQFELGEEKTRVYSQLQMRRNPAAADQQRSLVLFGEALTLISVHKDKKPLAVDQYEQTPTDLTIHNLPEVFSLEIVTQIEPQNNTALSGLYRSGKLFCTQCEAQGFRRITYYLDRPDVMAPFTTTIVADKTKYPVMLSNGNKVAKGEYADNRHWVTWEDPFKKPSYLFALVAGPLSVISDSFTTQSGRKVALEIFVEPENIHKCAHAMQALKNSMQWDEKKYGREYDLDIYMIVAVNDFNMGAMENKGLNIFNAKYVLANEKTATDTDFQLIEAVIGHEYFHNWTGNRITCRDWFQLSLKEGLTVFREQQFSADMGSAAVKRIQDVRIIRTRQFAEDASPMAHPVRPDSYMEINNFYTSTIYNKGSEVIRMLHTLLGEQRFRKGMDLYFERNDGKAVTIEEFVAAFADANDYDLKQFHRWYDQAGTVQVKGISEYDHNKQQFTLTLTQTCSATPDNKEKLPFVIPVKIALLDQKGKILPIVTKSALERHEEGEFLVFNQAQQTFVFEQVLQKPVLSLFGNFSAPVQWHYPYEQGELMTLMINDPDPFNRWDAAQRIGLQAINTLMKLHQENKPLTVSEDFINAYRKLLQEEVSDPEFFSQLLSVPSFQYVSQTLSKVNVEALIAARKAVVETLSGALETDFERLYQLAAKNDDGAFNGTAIGYRALKNTCLAYWAYNNSPRGLAAAYKQYQNSKNMTDTMGALSAINHSPSPLRQQLFQDFYDQWKKEPLVVNKWLALQASSQLPDTLSNIKHLLTHDGFDINNPNKVYALIGTFGSNNPERFHDHSGHGYNFIADRVIELNNKNPQVASHVINGLTQWKRIEGDYGIMMKKALEKIQHSGHLSKDVNEIVTKSLQ